MLYGRFAPANSQPDFQSAPTFSRTFSKFLVFVCRPRVTRIPPHALQWFQGANGSTLHCDPCVSLSELRSVCSLFVLFARHAGGSRKHGIAVGKCTCAAWTRGAKVSSTTLLQLQNRTLLQTLVCTRWRDSPLTRLSERLRCPRCACRRVAVMFGPPSNGISATAASAHSYSWTEW